jgi:uncharacterized YigZ family protein
MNNTDIFKTIVDPCTGIYKEKGSRFLSYVYPVSNEREIKEILVKIRKEHHGARHHCYVWRLGTDLKNYRLNDDGEPSGTAGRPIFGQIQSKELTNILIIVVRYFGGILLGTNGLINAYKQSTIEALKKAVIVERTVENIIEVNFNYTAMNDFMHVIKEMKLQPILHSEIGMKCSATIIVRKSLSESVIEKLKQIDNLSSSIIQKKI